MGKLGPCLTSLQAGLPSSCPCLGAEQPEVTSKQQPPGDGAPGPCSGAAGSGALTTADWYLWLNPTGSPVQAPLEVDVPGGRPGTRGRGHSSQHEQIPRWLWLPGSVPHEVGGGHPGYSCFPFWVPIPAMGRVKPQEVARSTRLVSAMGVGPAMPLLSARYHSIRYFIPSSHQNAPYASLLN